MSKDYDQLLKDSRLKLGSISLLPFDYRSAHPRLAHSHVSELEILYAVSGSSEEILDCCPYHLSRNDLIVINSGTIHDELSNRSHDMDTFVISMSGLRLPGQEENQLVRPNQSPLIPAGPHSAVILNLMRCIEGTNREHYEEASDICSRLLYILVKRLMVLLDEFAENERKTTSPAVRREISIIRDFLDAHYMEDISLESIAKGTHISASHISHIFKDYTGFSPIQYLTRRRLGEAETLLIHTDIKIADIASQCGYGTISNFNYSFQKYVGFSPIQYRRRHRELQSFSSEHPTILQREMQS